jgi:hypothetical protein
MTVAAMVIGAFITALAYTTVPLYQRWANQTQAPSIPMFVAELSNTHNAVWVEGQVGALRHSQLVAGHRMELRQGLAEITFHSGATVLLEGPAVLTLNGSGRATLDAGRLTARVPAQARGFTIATKQASIIDLGTEFGVAVEPTRATMVRVFEGRVVVDPTTADERYTLLAGDVLTTAADGVIANEHQSPRVAAMPFVREFPDAKYERLVATDRPVAWWRMEDAGRTTVRDASGHSHRGLCAGQVRAVESSIGLGRAAQLDGKSFIHVPDFPDLSASPALTVEAWIRCAAEMPASWDRIVEKDFTSGFVMTVNPASAPNVNLSPQHAIFGINGVFAQTVGKVTDGQWHHLVGVWNGQSIQIYCDGEASPPVPCTGPLGRSKHLLLIGANSANANYECFRGEIDEVAIYDRALAFDEIKSHFRASAQRTVPADEPPEQ